MKKILFAAFVLTLISTLTLCAAPKKNNAGQSQTSAAAPAKSAKTAAPVTYSKIDLDLTKQSATMIYAQVFNMMLDPASFDGKVIKLNGACAIYHDEGLNKDFYACIVMDATACCAQGLEFVLSDQYKKSQYPTANQEITITGLFQTYQINGLDSFHLINTIME